MYVAKRPFSKPIIFLFILAALVFSACSAAARQSQNWPGITAEGDKVYVAHGLSVFAYDTATQTVEWTYPSGDEGGSVQYYAAPSTLNGRVIFGDFGQAKSLINPGQIVSIYGVSDPPDSSSDWVNSELAEDKIIAPILQDGERAFVATGDSKLFAVDVATGAPLWSAPFEVENPIWGSMAYDDGEVYAAAMDGNVYAVDAESGNENGRWETETSFPSGLTMDGDALYVGGYDNKLHAFDKTSPGSEFWSVDTEAGIWGAPTVAEGSVIFGDMDGNVYVVDAASGKTKWQNSVPGPIVTSPAISDGVIYIASEGDPESKNKQWYLTAFNLEDSTQLWQQNPPTGIYTTPVIVNDAVVSVLFGDADELLVAYDKTSGNLKWSYTPES